MEPVSFNTQVSLGQLLKNHLNQVNELEEASDQLIQDYTVGKPVELHNVMIAESKAGLVMDLTVQLCNKAIAAYQTVGR